MPAVALHRHTNHSESSQKEACLDILRSYAIGCVPRAMQKLPGGPVQFEIKGNSGAFMAGESPHDSGLLPCQMKAMPSKRQDSLMDMHLAAVKHIVEVSLAAGKVVGEVKRANGADDLVPFANKKHLKGRHTILTLR